MKQYFYVQVLIFLSLFFVAETQASQIKRSSWVLAPEQWAELKIDEYRRTWQADRKKYQQVLEKLLIENEEKLAVETDHDLRAGLQMFYEALWREVERVIKLEQSDPVMRMQQNLKKTDSSKLALDYEKRAKASLQEERSSRSPKDFKARVRVLIKETGAQIVSDTLSKNEMEYLRFYLNYLNETLKTLK